MTGRAKITAGLALALLAAGVVAVVVQRHGTPSVAEQPHGAGANIWVDRSGGPCDYSAQPQNYDDASACGSVGAAYTKAIASTTSSPVLVLVKRGVYPEQDIVGDRGSTKVV